MPKLTKGIQQLTGCGTRGLEWLMSESPIPYPDALAAMERRVLEITNGTAEESVWLLEHPPLYTAGTSAQQMDLLDPGELPVYRAGRGGQFTYHGPGQRVAYVMLDLAARGKMDLRSFVRGLEMWLIATLADLGVTATRRDGRVGIWVEIGGGVEAKIAAIGIRVRRWVTFHGVSLNISPDLTHYDGIVACGLSQYGSTSLSALGINKTMLEVDQVLIRNFKHVIDNT